MLIYLAGGFHFSNKVESEMKLAEHLLERYGRYNRLCTFYYRKDAGNILTVKRQLDEKEKDEYKDEYKEIATCP